MCKVIYGYKDLESELKHYYILDPVGFNNFKRNIAFDLNFKIQRRNYETLRKLYFTIFEIDSIIRELNFRMVNPNFVLSSTVNKINTSLPLTWKNGMLSLREPVIIETDSDFDDEMETSVNIDLSKFTGLKNLILKAKVKLQGKKLIAELNLFLRLDNRGIDKNVSEEEINKLLKVNSREVNQKSLISQSQLDEIGEGIIQSLVEPIIEKEREEFQRKSGFSDFVYIPSDRTILLNVSESALTNEEISQLFSQKCSFALYRVKEGIKKFKPFFSKDVKVENGVLFWGDKPIGDAPPNVKSLAVIDAELSTVSQRGFIVVEYPEQYLTEEEIEKVTKKLKELGELHELIIITGNKKIKEECEK
ncbi:MAG: hypothetical protein JZD40_04885 [Sulfolobus sp.]|nr:hypothetical protein [Sulfolobus sp.]